MDVERLAAEGKFVEVVKYFSNRSLENAAVGEFLALLVSLYHLDAVEDAKKILEMALTNYPDNIELILNAAEIYYHTSDFKRAFDFAKEAILRGVQDPYIYDIIGTYYAFIGE
ncbi:MAG: tetratricopeptide repeat protein [Fervidobacterium sp.]